MYQRIILNDFTNVQAFQLQNDETLFFYICNSNVYKIMKIDEEALTGVYSYLFTFQYWDLIHCSYGLTPKDWNIFIFFSIKYDKWIKKNCENERHFINNNLSRKITINFMSVWFYIYVLPFWNKIHSKKFKYCYILSLQKHNEFLIFFRDTFVTRLQ